jgi:hypothetical protein
MRIALAAAALLAACAGAPVRDNNVDLARVQVRRLMTACEAYKAANGKTPENLNQLIPQQMEVIPKDPWGHDFVYPATPGTCDVVSKGPDGAQGSSDDISSHGEQPTAYTK